ncbi:DUF4435 domain-containing protein [Candidatus Poribacteria bacterium]|nr:DUF4435 domain-containing protein [Candidatus Poribacteria bacterium]MYH79193.1 DUF4435 domain-containing protein [Candidatus Poribacteria bacterium]MYK92400.1 DUF4435 domain-containing protein [Candidatus Poribacteria bacterium]
MSLPDSTLENLVDALRFSNKPNIIVEGQDDEIIYGTLVERLGRFDVGFFSAGSKETLLQLYEELSEYENAGDFRHAPVAFIADRDMWLFRRIPDQYDDIIWTEGYSIENDLYSYAKLRDRIGNEAEYDQILDAISMWFAYKVEEYLEKNPPEKIFESIRDEEHVDVAYHLNQVVPPEKTTLSPDLEFLSSDHERVREVRSAYHLQLRGKLLFQLLVRFLNKPKQGFTDATVSYHGLYNDAITVPESNQLFSRLEKEVQEKLDKQKR